MLLLILLLSLGGQWNKLEVTHTHTHTDFCHGTIFRTLLADWRHNQITKYNYSAQKVLHVNWVVENQRYPPRAWVQGYKHTEVHISTIKRPYQLLGSRSFQVKNSWLESAVQCIR